MRTGNDFYLDINLEDGDNQVVVRASKGGMLEEEMFVVHKVAESETEDKETAIEPETSEVDTADSTPSQSQQQPEVAPSAPPQTQPAKPAPSQSSSGSYESIYNTYAAKLRAQCPALSMMECAELSNEGISKMAEYMYRASGTDGQYQTYESWAGKLQDVYMAEAR